MSFVIDRVLDVALTPSLARAVDLLEIDYQGFQEDSKRPAQQLDAAKLAMWQQQEKAREEKLIDLAVRQRAYSVGDFLERAMKLADERIAERRRIGLIRAQQRRERAERRAEELAQFAFEERLIKSGALA